MPSQAHPVILFDGVCNLCDASVQFILDRDPTGKFRFASLQSPAGQRLTGLYGIDPMPLDTIVLIADGKAFVRSDAVLGIARRLGAPWSWAAALTVIPLALRDAAYRLVSRNRIRWFGQRDECRLPTPDLRSRFLDL